MPFQKEQSELQQHHEFNITCSGVYRNLEEHIYQFSRNKTHLFSLHVTKTETEQIMNWNWFVSSGFLSPKSKVCCVHREAEEPQATCPVEEDPYINIHSLPKLMDTSTHTTNHNQTYVTPEQPDISLTYFAERGQLLSILNTLVLYLKEASIIY